jgi:hypothetical protein
MKRAGVKKAEARHHSMQMQASMLPWRQIGSLSLLHTFWRVEDIETFSKPAAENTAIKESICRELSGRHSHGAARPQLSAGGAQRRGDLHRPGRQARAGGSGSHPAAAGRQPGGGRILLSSQEPPACWFLVLIGLLFSSWCSSSLLSVSGGNSSCIFCVARFTYNRRAMESAGIQQGGFPLK